MLRPSTPQRSETMSTRATRLIGIAGLTSIVLGIAELVAG